MVKIKHRPEDFKVVEVLKRPLKNKGDYRVYRLWKRGITTEEALELIAKRSGISKRQISICGVKDRHAETSQFIAVKREFRLKEISSPELKLSFAGYTYKRLSPSELKGNLFEIVVRDVKPPKRKRIEVLTEVGIPNYYGEQRFLSVKQGKFFLQVLIREGVEEALRFLFLPSGWEESRSRKGKRLFLKGRFREAAGLLRGWRRKVALFLSSGGSMERAFKLVPEEEFVFQANVLQSLLFNKKLSELVEVNCERKTKFVYRAGTLFYPLEKFELFRTLPMFCRERTDFYIELLERLGLSLEGIAPYWELFHQFERRALVKPRNLSIEGTSSSVRLSFLLPSGAYATNVIRFLFSSVEVL